MIKQDGENQWQLFGLLLFQAFPKLQQVREDLQRHPFVRIAFMLEEQTDKRRLLTISEPHAINQIREAFFQLFIHERFFLDFE